MNRNGFKKFHFIGGTPRRTEKQRAKPENFLKNMPFHLLSQEGLFSQNPLVQRDIEQVKKSGSSGSQKMDGAGYQIKNEMLSTVLCFCQKFIINRLRAMKIFKKSLQKMQQIKKLHRDLCFLFLLRSL